MARSRTVELATEPARTKRRYGGQSPDERRTARRERLFEAALATFGTSGYSSSTIEGICSEAAVTARHFYEEHTSREALLVATYDRIIARTEAALRASTVAPLPDVVTTSETRLAAAVRAFLDEMLSDPRAARIACLEVVGVSPALERHRRETGRAFAATIAVAIEAIRPELSADRHRLEATSIVVVGGVTELVVDWLDREVRRPPSEIAADIVAILGAMVRGYEP